jgi:hypothetical protein
MKITVEIPDDKNISLDKAMDKIAEAVRQVTDEADQKQR